LALESVVTAHYVDGLVIDKSHFFNVDGGAVLVRGRARNVVIKDNIFRYVGETMIALLGETSAPNLPKEWGFGWDGRAGMCACVYVSMYLHVGLTMDMCIYV
jgi:hypothetical protein